MQQTIGLGFFILLSCGAVHLQAAEYYVAQAGQTPSPSGDYTSWDAAASNIQQAVTAAGAAGNTVWVSNGTYRLTGQITVGNVKLRSWPDGLSNRDTTMVDGNYPAYTNRCFALNHADALVEGFSITNGYYINTSTSDRAHGGGGVYMTAGMLRNCLLTGNAHTNAVGAGTYSGGGGGVAMYGASSVVFNCDIIGNRALSGLGGGVMVCDSAQVWNCNIISNASPSSNLYKGGGGISIDQGWVYNCSIVGNTAVDGGGVSIPRYTGGGLRNCLIADNTATDVGGVYAMITTLGAVLENCTVVNNKGATTGGICQYINDASRTYLTNCIVYDNIGTYNIRRRNGTIHCDHVCTTNTSGVTFVGDGNITNQAPGFVNVSGGDYRLLKTSPCVEVGTNQLWMVGAFDLYGNPRKDWSAGIVDLGCFEYTPQHPAGTVLMIQ